MNLQEITNLVDAGEKFGETYYTDEDIFCVLLGGNTDIRPFSHGAVNMPPDLKAAFDLLTVTKIEEIRHSFDKVHNQDWFDVLETVIRDVLDEETITAFDKSVDVLEEI